MGQDEIRLRLITPCLQIPALRPREYATISHPKKTVQRAYGGSRCANCVKDRVVRAFLIEEQKIVKKVMKEAEKKQTRR
jgi:large subunit ribosomal protein L34e